MKHRRADALFPLAKKPSTRLTDKPSTRRWGKPVVVRNDGGALTSDAGVLLLREIDEQLELTEKLAACIRDERDQSKLQHSVHDMLRQRIYGIACGYEDCNDATTLRMDPALKMAVGRAPGEYDLASQPTLSRLETGVGWRECWRMSEALVEAYIQRHRRRPPRRIVLDVDATDDETHGNQQLAFFHGYYDHHCFLPLLIFAQAGASGEQEPIAAVLRPGNKHAHHRAMTLVKLLVKRLRAAFPDCRIELRADSGFASPEVYEGCESLLLRYSISLAKNSVLLEMIEPSMQKARALFAESGEKVQLFGEFRYRAQSWDRERRVVFKAEVTSEGDNPRFVVTYRNRKRPQNAYRWYCLRGDAENRIKELKVDLCADRLSCHGFFANQFRLLLHVAAYVLIQRMRTRLHGTALAKAQVGTLRLRLLKVGARIIETVRRVSVQLPTAYPWMDLWPRLLSAAPS
jgi:hypothetical protein